MIKKITILDEYRTIPEKFLLELKHMTVITGENNSGKSNFIRAVAGLAKVGKKEISVEFLDESEKPVTPKIVYIGAENIKPDENEAKFSAKTTNLIKNLSTLFSNLERKFILEGHSEIVGEIENLIKKASENLKGFKGNDEHSLDIKFNNEELDSSVVIQALISEISCIEGEEPRGLDELGQGTQRVIVASLLKAYADILVEKNICTENPILILFEEPEIYLHPKLKRSLNATLEKISGQPNHQVIIITHDPYFAFMNYGDIEEVSKKIVSFVKMDGKTIISEDGVIDGIEDELLFVFLYSLLMKNSGKIDSTTIKVGKISEREYHSNDKKYLYKRSDLRYIRDQIHHLGDNGGETLGLVKEVPKDVGNKNYFTVDELSEAIKRMTEALAKYNEN